MSEYEALTDEEQKMLSLFPLDLERLTEDELSGGMNAKFDLHWPPWTGFKTAVHGLRDKGYIVRVDVPAFDGWVLTERGKAEHPAASGLPNPPVRIPDVGRYDTNVDVPLTAEDYEEHLGKDHPGRQPAAIPPPKK